MATARSQDAICRIVEDRILELETESGLKPNYIGVVMMEGMLVVIDYMTRMLQVNNGHDGKLISTSHRLESDPYDVCLISKNEVALCQSDGTVVIVALKSKDDVKPVKTLKTGFDPCYSLAKWNSEKLVVSGVKDFTLCWGIFSIRDGRMDSTYDICEGSWTHMAIKDNTVYISCWTRDSITNGVYAYDIFNPRTRKFLYQHQQIKIPWSIMAERDYVYMCDSFTNRIHQLTDSGQLVTIHTVLSNLYGIFHDDQHGLLYTTSISSNEITVYTMESLHQTGVPIEILKMDDRSIQRFEEALKDGKETVHSIRIMVVGHMGVGKTTLVKRLLGEEANISERHSTKGIDVYVNCCDVSLSTHEWTRRTKDSEQDYKLQRLVKVISENYQTGGRDVEPENDAISNERETTDGNPLSLVADDNTNTEVPYRRFRQQKIGEILSSTPSLQNESSSTAVQGSLNQSETNTIPGSKIGENVATENYKMDPLREMFKLLQQNSSNAKQDISKHAHLTILDFAGQYAFYTTHQMFLTKRAIYLLVSDASQEVDDIVEDDFYFDTEGRLKCKVHDLAQVWMNSIHSCALPDKENLNSANSHTLSYKVLPPPVILVGTHIDKIPQKRPSMFGTFARRICRIVYSGGNNPDPRKPLNYDLPAQQDYRRERGQSYLMDIRSYLRDKPTAVHLVDEDFAIDNTILDDKLEELKKKIVEVASQQPYWGEQIPTRWYLLEQQLMRLRDAGVKGQDPDAPITREHMNHARLCVVLVTVCGNAMREVLSTHVPSPYTDIHHAILANKSTLTRLFNSVQRQLVFPDPNTTGKVDQLDLSLLYTLIRNISTVLAPVTGWGHNPQDQPRDNSLGASVERIRSYRNHIIGHSMDGKIRQQVFDDYWNNIDAVLDDIELKLGRQGYRAQLEKQKTQVISVYEAC